MHAVAVRVSIGGDLEVARKELRERIVPQVSKAPGFVAGYWTSSEDGSNGQSMIVFESKDAAKAVAEHIRTGLVPDAVTLESIEVREVVATA
jgi:hypothetical protein